MKKIFNVTGMHCKSCEMLITDSLEDEAGILEVIPSFKDGIVKVSFDDNLITEQKIRSIIKKEGYEVR